MYTYTVVHDPLPAELQSRAEQFKTAVNQLVDLLDLNHPSTMKLKVIHNHCNNYRIHGITYILVSPYLQYSG